MINYYNDKICLNVLANDIDNAKEIYEVMDGNVIVGVLSASYPTVEEAVTDMHKYVEVLEGNLSVGLGAGDPNQWSMVAEIAKSVKANHFNQVFTAVGHTRANVCNDIAHINALVSPSGEVGKVVISTGPISAKCDSKAVVPVEVAIDMIKDMGGNSLKFFPMGGLKCKDELIAVAKACASKDFVLEPTGGIDLNNFEEIVKIILDAGVKKVIPHVYSSIIDSDTNVTRIDDVNKLYEIMKKLA